MSTVGRALTGLRIAARPGVTAGMELGIRFADWASGLRNEPTIDQIVDRWGVCRSTAFRWRMALRAARGRTDNAAAGDNP